MIYQSAQLLLLHNMRLPDQTACSTVQKSLHRPRLWSSGVPRRSLRSDVMYISVQALPLLHVQHVTAETSDWLHVSHVRDIIAGDKHPEHQISGSARMAAAAEVSNISLFIL